MQNFSGKIDWEQVKPYSRSCYSEVIAQLKLCLLSLINNLIFNAYLITPHIITKAGFEALVVFLLEAS